MKKNEELTKVVITKKLEIEIPIYKEHQVILDTYGYDWERNATESLMEEFSKVAYLLQMAERKINLKNEKK